MLRDLLLFLLRLYRATLSPLLGNVCRFEPSCSRYASACIERFGAARGTWLAAKRLCKCHPFHPGGYDPPPLEPEGPSAPPPGSAAGHRTLACAPPGGYDSPDGSPTGSQSR